jgi:hypothetical protein
MCVSMFVSGQLFSHFETAKITPKKKPPRYVRLLAGSCLRISLGCLACAPRIQCVRIRYVWCLVSICFKCELNVSCARRMKFMITPSIQCMTCVKCIMWIKDSVIVSRGCLACAPRVTGIWSMNICVWMRLKLESNMHLIIKCMRMYT